MRAAQEAMSIYKDMGNKHAEATSLHLMANAQLMSQNNPEALKMARAAEKMFKDIGDGKGQAGSLLLVAGAHLGEGEFAEAKDVAKDAREVFREIESATGEESADDFLDALKQYESGKLSRFDFMGFSMSGAAQDQQDPQRPSKKKQDKGGDIIDNNIKEEDMMMAGKQSDKYLVIAYDGIEVRAPGGGRAPTRAAKKERVQDLSAAAGAASSKEAVYFSVKWVAANE